MNRIHHAFGVLNGWKTAVFSFVLAASPLLVEALSQLQGIDLTPIFKDYAPTIVSVIGVATFLLRVYSVGTLGNNGPRS